MSREEAAGLDHSEMAASNGVNGGQAGGEFKPDVSSTVLFSARVASAQSSHRSYLNYIRTGG